MPEPDCLAAYAALAGADERARHRQIAHPARRLRHARTYGGLRLALREVTGRSATAEIMFSPFGKPAMQGEPHFSVSHASGGTWVAICPDEPVGLDVVQTGGAVALDDCFVSQSDRDALAALAVPLHDIDVACWAVKEACAKLADDVDLPPCEWRVHSAAGQLPVSGHLPVSRRLPVSRQLIVRSFGHRPIAVHLLDAGPRLLAAIAQWHCTSTVPKDLS